MYNPFSLERKKILVTGASSGIGRSTAIECSKLGAQIYVLGRNKTKLEETLSLLEGNNNDVVIADLEDFSCLDNIVELVDSLDGYVSNAGFTITSPLNFIKEEQLTQLMKVNTISPIILLQKLLKKKKLNKNASVVFTSSLAGISTCTYGNSMYSATKGAISAFVRNAAIDLAPKNIRVNAVCPGMVNTNILSSGTIDEEQLKEDLKNYPLGRYGDPKDVALGIVYLLSEASSWVTGTNMVIDGGVSIK